ncbi:hypothetical protein ACP70R_048304 [Stipagrostis hirtigluma subsp. patula]
MFRWGKSGKSPAPAGSGGGTGEVKVQKVERIEVRNVVTRPAVYGVPRAPRRGVGAEGDDINRKAEEFIKQRKTWFHNQMVAVGPAPPRPPPPPPRVVS